MPKTFSRSQLIERILEKHKVIGEGQTATAGQRNIADKVIDPAIEELRRIGAVSLDADYPMPIEYQEHLADFCKYFCAEDFSRVQDIQNQTIAVVKMREIQASMPTFQTVQVDPLFGPNCSSGYTRNAGYWSR